MFIPGTNMETTYFGYTWWDNEADGESMYPHDATQSDRRGEISGFHCAIRKARRRAACGPILSSWKISAARNSTSNCKQTQFADFHSHGWVFRAVYKRDRKGNLLDGRK